MYLPFDLWLQTKAPNTAGHSLLNQLLLSSNIRPLKFSSMNFPENASFSGSLPYTLSFFLSFFFPGHDVNKRPGIPQGVVFFVPHCWSLEMTSEASSLPVTNSICFAFWCTQVLRCLPVKQLEWAGKSLRLIPSISACTLKASVLSRSQRRILLTTLEYHITRQSMILLSTGGCLTEECGCLKRGLKSLNT